MCTSPKKGFLVGLTKNGLPHYKVVSHSTACLRRGRGGSWMPVPEWKFADMLKTFSIDEFTTDLDYNFDWVPLPCGQCDECRLQRSRDWANRLMMEMQSHPDQKAYFLTLTYSDDFVPRSSYCDPVTGDDFPALTLRKKEIQDWMKRLRKKFASVYGSPVPFNYDDVSTWEDDRRVRYYLCGEYGGNTFRPHYHVIMFSPPIPDADFCSHFVGITETNHSMYNSPWLSSTWACDGVEKGWLTYSEVTWNTCAYVARYCLKKRYGAEADFYAVHNIEPEFSLQSTRPGIGWKYFMDHPDLLLYEYITLSTDEKGIKFSPPRYFKKLFEKVHGVDEAVKAARLARARQRDESLLLNTTLSYEEHMQVRERNIKARLSQLKRGYEDAQENVFR